MRKLLYSILLIAFLSSCTQKHDKLEIVQGFLSEVQADQNTTNALVIIIDELSCNDCRILTYRNLLATTYAAPITMILSGQIPEEAQKTRPFLNRIELKGVKIIHDNSKTWQASKRKAGFNSGDVVFVDYNDNRVKKITRLSSDMVNGEVDIRKDIFMGYIE